MGRLHLTFGLLRGPGLLNLKPLLDGWRRCFSRLLRRRLTGARGQLLAERVQLGHQRLVLGLQAVQPLQDLTQLGRCLGPRRRDGERAQSGDRAETPRHAALPWRPPKFIPS